MKRRKATVVQLAARRRKGLHAKRFDPDWAVWAYYKGPLDREKDRALFKAGGGYSDGSGYDFVTGERDHSWSCYDERAAIGLARAIRKKVPSVRVKVLRRRVRWVQVRVPR